MLNGHRRQRVAQRERSCVAHEHTRGVAVVQKECDERAGERHRHRLLAGRSARQQQRHRDQRDHGEAAGQAVHAVGDVDGIRRGGDDEHGQGKEEPDRQGQQELVRALLRHRDRGHRHGQKDLNRKLEARRDAERAHAQLAAVVRETDGAAGNQSCDGRPRTGVPGESREKPADNAENTEKDAAPGWGAGFFLMAVGQLRLDHLSLFQPPQHADEGRIKDERDRERDHESEDV